MYIPKDFRQEDRRLLHRFMRAFSFATLVTCRSGAPFATHLPVLLDADRGSLGVLLAHMARANPQWRDLAAGEEALVIFQGPHRYITPSWYTEHPSVPTWNYTVVHAYGRTSIIDDRTGVLALLERLVATHEAAFAEPWILDVSDEWTAGLTSGIVAFEIELTRIEGKFKLNQNRSQADREAVIRALLGSREDADRQLGEFMANPDGCIAPPGVSIP
ncbi:MAG TPA: FMN-binding negative transcriptional regulator [Candidatus Kapabacteria bacterium]|nr:FMN-binding negative transcriptional regulator [Candidatus Kapabacteria bacterium]